MPALEKAESTAIAEAESSQRVDSATQDTANEACGLLVRSSHESRTAACSACGAEETAPAAFKRGRTLHQCCSCGTVFVWPQPTDAELTALYCRSSGYFATAADDLAETSSAGARSIHRRLTSAGVPGYRLLDVGCGQGQLIYHLRDLGWTVHGVDVNADTARIARANGLDVVTGDLASCHWPHSSFDVINMGDLIEHVRDPLGTLRCAFRLLSKGGLLLIRTPNAACGFASSTRSLFHAMHLPWPHSEAPYHLHEFTPQGISRLVWRAGFETTGLQCSGCTPFWYTLGGIGWFDDLKTRMKRSGRYRFDWRLFAAAPKLAGTVCLLFPFHLYGTLTDRLRRTGRTITLMARCPSVVVRKRPPHREIA